MPLQILGLNHNTAPVEIREQVVFSGDEVPRALERMLALDGIDEAVLLSTCNRTEFYVIGQDGGGGLSTIGPLIGEALYVTGYGLMVAIPSVMLFNWLSGLISKYEAGLANAGSELVDQLEAGALGGDSHSALARVTPQMNGDHAAPVPAE